MAVVDKINSTKTIIFDTSFQDMFCVSRKGGTGGGGWVPPPQDEKSMSVSGLSCKRPWLALDGHYFSPPLHKQQFSDLIVPPFLIIKLFSLRLYGWLLAESCDY